MALQQTDGAAVSMMSPCVPQHVTTDSTSASPESPRKDVFKRMSTASITTPLSESSTRPNSMNTVYTEEPPEISSPVSRGSLSLETNPFLTAVAAQERRVLELREELQKAETNLQILKRNWAQQEATRKRQEIKQHAEAMRPLVSPTKSIGSSTPTAESFRQNTDEERRRAFHARPRIPERRVFEGRHARTLSLLSPGALANRAPPQIRTPTAQSPPVVVAETAMKSIDSAVEQPAIGVPGRAHAGSKGAREDIVNTGRQFVGDIREGLWSFWDDLRQATVGEEALKEPPSRRATHQAISANRSGAPSRKSSSSTLKQPDSRKASRSPHARSRTTDLSQMSGSKTPLRTPSKARHLETTASGDIVRTDVEDDGGWSNWDSPATKTAPSTAQTGNSLASTPRTSVSSTDDKIAPKDPGYGQLDGSSETQAGSASDTIPWPALKKLRPGSLQRTASHLMREWERSLTPPAEDAERDWIDKYIDGPRRSSTREGTPISR